jgi:hypothetical protein
VSRIAHLEGTIRGWIAAEIDLTLAELSARLAGQDIAIKVPALWRQLNKWKLSSKIARLRASTRRHATGSA